jgi:hypothetical protein
MKQLPCDPSVKAKALMDCASGAGFLSIPADALPDLGYRGGMSFLDGRASRSRRVLPILLAAALMAPAFAFPSVADCCAGKMPCCPMAASEGRGADAEALAAALKAPVPPCCQTLAPGDAPAAEGRKGTVPAPAALALPSPSIHTSLALACAGRIAPKVAALFEDPPSDSRTARAPPCC